MISLLAPLKLAGLTVALFGAAYLGVPAARQPTPSARAAVIGGAPAPPAALSSVAEILNTDGHQVHKCTGTVVSATVILTAGHCAENGSTGAVNKSSGYTVLTGGAGGSTVTPQVSTVFAVIVNEGFHRRTVDDDAALLILSAPVAAPPVRLATGADRRELRPGSTAMIVGLGKTSYAQPRPTVGARWAATVLQAAPWCSRYARPFFAGSEICAVDPRSYRTGACYGDSGGPLLALDTARAELVQIGITSHGYGRCSTRLPSVFTRVDPIASWVEAWIQAYPPRPVPSAPQP
jgi:secreted trypsin-like serine protease